MSFRSTAIRKPRRRRALLIVVTIACLVFLLSLIQRDARHTGRQHDHDNWRDWPDLNLDLYRPSSGALKQQGARASMRENLRADKDYVISFPNYGWNNQVFEVFNLISLAVRTRRIPILMPFWPHGTHYDEDFDIDLPVGKVFNLSHVRTVLADKPIIEMHELKRTEGLPNKWADVEYGAQGRLNVRHRGPIRAMVPDIERLGCWSFYQNVGIEAAAPSDRALIDLDYTPLPPEIFFGGRSSWGSSIITTADHVRRTHESLPSTSLETLRQFGFPLPEIIPDHHLACIDSTYWLVEEPERYDLHGEYRAGRGVWAAIGQHMKFRQELLNLGANVLRKLFHLSEAMEISPYIAIHIRRGDFGREWFDLTPRHYAHQASVVKERIRDDLGLDVNHIVIATDETDPSWLHMAHTVGIPLRQYGFFFIQDVVTSDEIFRKDVWLPVVIDSVILSGGKGFVGPSTSTMAILSYLRTKFWQDGIATFISAGHQVPPDWEWIQ